MKVTALKLKDEVFGNQWFDEVEDHWDYANFQGNPSWREGWLSFDCALYHSGDDRVYLGLTSFAADIFWAFDRKTRQFVDLGYERLRDPFDAKFHRSLLRSKDGCLYATVALLHDVDRYHEAPGAAIIRYDPRSGDLAKIGIPLPHVYIQALALDEERRTLYCLCFPPEYLVAFNINSGESRNLGLIGSGYGGMAQGENLVLDDEGCVWCAWSLTRAWQNTPGADAARLCKFDPREDRIHFYQTGLPWPDGRHGYAKPEAFFNFGDGFIYASGANGSLYRVDTQTGKAEYLFTPTPNRRSRLSAMVKIEEGVAYGVTGRDYNCEMMRVNYKAGTFEKIGKIVDDQGNALWQCHDLALADDGVLYVCENDNPYRSAYLWEVTPK